jgi:hypothetical protein
MSEEPMEARLHEQCERLALEARVYRAVLRLICHSPDRVAMGVVRDSARTMLTAAADLPDDHLLELVNSAERRLGPAPVRQAAASSARVL